MKSKLAIFFLGFGAGIAAAFLMIGLAPDRPESRREASSPMVIYNNTNATAAWTQKQSSVRWQIREP
jgi:hypothetical protein